jgi:hypothetical protein
VGVKYEDLKVFIAVSVQAQQGILPVCANISFFGMDTVR